MRFDSIIKSIADILKDFDTERPIDQSRYRPGIGPFRESQLVRQVAERLTGRGVSGERAVAQTHRTPDMSIRSPEQQSGLDSWAIEFKIVRPFGDNGNEAEDWSQNLLHPYIGNVSLIGDALKITGLDDYQCKGLVAICYQHESPQIDLEPLVASFELISRNVMHIPLGERIEEKRSGLVHPIHQMVRCIGWQLGEGSP